MAKTDWNSMFFKHVKKREQSHVKKSAFHKADDGCSRSVFCQFESLIFKETHTAQSAPVQSWSASKKRKAAQKNIASATAKAIHAKT